MKQTASSQENMTRTAMDETALASPSTTMSMEASTNVSSNREADAKINLPKEQQSLQPHQKDPEEQDCRVASEQARPFQDDAVLKLEEQADHHHFHQQHSRHHHHQHAPLFQCCTGMSEDLKARVPLYRSDFGRPDNLLTVVNAIFFAFVVQLIPALIFSELMAAQTEGRLGVAETLLSTGVIGILYALLAGQPLVLLGITGPVAMLLGTSYGLAETFSSDYWSFFFWMCLWTALLHLITACTGLINLVFRMTPFTSEIFEFFIAASFMYEALRDVLLPIGLAHDGEDKSAEERSSAYATLVLAILTFYCCFTLHFAETWVYYNHALRTFLTSYNMAISVIIATALSYLPGVDQQPYGISRVHVKAPWDWQPTDPSRGDRWLIDPLYDIGPTGIFGALFPAFMLYLLFYVDHNISSMLTQSYKYNLTKPPAYHWDFFCLGLTILPCGIMGLPPGSGLIPQAPLHTRALSTRRHDVIHGIQTEVVTHVEEQRWSALFQAALMFVALALFVVLSWIPQGALLGVFFYLGVTAMYGNEIWERIVLTAIQHDRRPPIPVVKHVAFGKVFTYTALQVSCAAVVFGVAQFTSVAYIFPALIMGLVPLRMFLVPFLFDETSDLRYLDPVDKTEEEWHAERVALHDALVQNAEADPVDLFPGRSSFRANEFAHGLEEHEFDDDGDHRRDDNDSESCSSRETASSRHSSSMESYNADTARQAVLRRRKVVVDNSGAGASDRDSHHSEGSGHSCHL